MGTVRARKEGGSVIWLRVLQFEGGFSFSFGEPAVLPGLSFFRLGGDLNMLGGWAVVFAVLGGKSLSSFCSSHFCRVFLEIYVGFFFLFLEAAFEGCGIRLTIA